MYNNKDKELNVDYNLRLLLQYTIGSSIKCDDQISNAINIAIKRLREMSNYKKIDELNEIDESYHLFYKGGLAAAEFAAFINGEMRDLKATLDPNVAFRIKDMDSFSSDGVFRTKK